MRLALPFSIALFAASLAGCTAFPELDGTVPPDRTRATPPALIPLAPLIAQSEASDQGGATAAADISPRLAALRARANRLRGPVIPAPERARMLRGPR